MSPRVYIDNLANMETGAIYRYDDQVATDAEHVLDFNPFGVCLGTR